MSVLQGRRRALSFRVGHSQRFGRDREERLTLDEVLPDVFERVSVLADALEHLGESIPVHVLPDQQILSATTSRCVEESVPEGLVVVQDVDVELSSAVDAKAELVMVLERVSGRSRKSRRAKDRKNSRHPWPCRSSPDSASSSRQVTWL